MVSGIEGVGEAVTGGMLARAVESEAGEDGHTHESHCLNCGAELAGAFCHQCGQKGHVHRTIAAWWHDFLHSVLHLDGKLWRTLPLLAWRPGELTRRYVHGERARFVSPMALFLFSVFLMFAVFSLVGGPFATEADPQATREAAADIQREKGQLDQRIAGLERQRREAEARRQSTISIDAELRRARRTRQALRVPEAIVIVPSNAPEGSAKTVDLRDGVDTGWPWLDRGIEKARDNPALLAYKLHRRRYRQFGAYDHVVFVTYSIAFMSLALIALSLLRPLGLGEVISGFVFILLPPIHMYWQLRGAYSLRWYSALWRTAALVVFAGLAAMIFFTLLLAIGALG
jgi:hypothetical protein